MLEKLLSLFRAEISQFNDALLMKRCLLPSSSSYSVIECINKVERQREREKKTPRVEEEIKCPGGGRENAISALYDGGQSRIVAQG